MNKMYFGVTGVRKMMLLSKHFRLKIRIIIWCLQRVVSVKVTLSSSKNTKSQSDELVLLQMQH